MTSICTFKQVRFEFSLEGGKIIYQFNPIRQLIPGLLSRNFE